MACVCGNKQQKKSLLILRVQNLREPIKALLQPLPDFGIRFHDSPLTVANTRQIKSL